MGTKKSEKKIKPVGEVEHFYGYILEESEDNYNSLMSTFECLPSNAVTTLERKIMNRDEIEEGMIDFTDPVYVVLYDLTDMVKREFEITNPIVVKEIFKKKEQ